MEWIGDNNVSEIIVLIWNYFYLCSVKEAYIALGSNIGNRPLSILHAFHKLSSLGSIKSTSFLYETPAKYYSDQPSFLNAACLLETKLTPSELLSSLKQIETEIGRETSFRNGPRCTLYNKHFSYIFNIHQ